MVLPRRILGGFSSSNLSLTRRIFPDFVRVEIRGSVFRMVTASSQSDKLTLNIHRVFFSDV